MLLVANESRYKKKLFLKNNICLRILARQQFQQKSAAAFLDKSCTTSNKLTLLKKDVFWRFLQFPLFSVFSSTTQDRWYQN